MPLLFFGACLFTAAAAPGHAGGSGKELARFMSREVRDIEARCEALTRELDTLPLPAGASTSARLGWHTPALPSAEASVWVQVDLGEAQPLDLLALVPASGEAERQGGPGYGFPVRFHVEAGDDAEFAAPFSVGNFTDADVVNPGASPVVVKLIRQRARFVRVTVTKAWPRRDDWIVALGELIVLSGTRNIAAGRPVHASHSLSSLPAWDASNLTDGQSLLGPPVSREPSVSNGYLAIQESTPTVTKWVQVDLGREVPLDEVCLFPARPTDFADSPGSGFPPRFRVEVASNGAFTLGRRLIFNTGERDFLNPGDNPVSFRANGEVARFVRVTAARLHDRGSVSSFALAEMQIWSGGKNVALGAAVSALDVFDNPKYPRWRPEYLVDGFNSRNRILDLPQWLAGLDRRRAIGQEIARLDAQRNAAADAALALVVRLGVGTLGGVVLLAGTLLWRARVAKHRDVEAVRRRIASDLHDEIGSNLGSIALLAEAARREGGAAHAAEDFAAIEHVAARTHESLREIVWFISPGAVTRTELVARMRESAPSLLGGIACEFHAPGALREGECPLEFARNVWLIFKETLHNAARHSGASRVSIRVAEPNGGFELEVRDDGRGFIESEVEPGNGLLNLRRRATELHGTLRITSEAGRGTTVLLTVSRS